MEDELLEEDWDEDEEDVDEDGEDFPILTRRSSRPAPQTPSRPLPDQPKAPRQPRSARPPKRMQEDEPGLELITRRPPKQKFANFEDYLAAHGGMTVPLPPEKTETPETAAPAAPAAE